MRQCRTSDVNGLLGLSDLGLRGRQLRLHSRFVRTRPQFCGHQRMNALQKDLPTVDGCAGGLRGLLGGDHGQECIRCGNGDVVARPVHGCLGLIARRCGSSDIGCAQTKVERLPGDQDPQAAIPDRAEIVRRNAIHARDDALWKQAGRKRCCAWRGLSAPDRQPVAGMRFAPNGFRPRPHSFVPAKLEWKGSSAARLRRPA